MTKKQVVGAIALVLAGILFGVILTSGFNAVKPTSALDVPIIGSQDKPTNTRFDILSTQNAFVQVAKEVVPTVVSIKVVSKSEGGARPFDFFHFFGPDFEFKIPEPRPQEGMGSGVIITKDGYFLTNNHVLEAIAVFMPTTSPFKLTRGPPLLPGLIAASVCIKFSTP